MLKIHFLLFSHIYDITHANLHNLAYHIPQIIFPRYGTISKKA